MVSHTLFPWDLRESICKFYQWTDPAYQKLTDFVYSLKPELIEDFKSASLAEDELWNKTGEVFQYFEPTIDQMCIIQNQNDSEENKNTLQTYHMALAT